MTVSDAPFCKNLKIHFCPLYLGHCCNFLTLVFNCIFERGLEDEIFSTQKKKEGLELLNLSIFPQSLLQFA